jgi:hypothetical protein
MEDEPVCVPHGGIRLIEWDSEGRESEAPMRAESGLVVCPRCGCAVSALELDMKRHEDWHAGLGRPVW